MNKNAKTKPFKIFVVEDDEWYNNLLIHTLTLNPDYEVVGFRKGLDVLQKLNDNPDVITLDYRLPDMDGAEVLKRVKQENPGIEVIVISEQQDVEVAVELLKLGAYDYILKSKEIRQRLLNTVTKIKEQSALKDQVQTLRKEIGVRYQFQKSIIGKSEPIRKVFERIEKAILTNITVTITGETGTGKELVAKAIHYASNRARNPFVAVNVTAIPRELTESELFGHEKGSFSGAATRHTGKFEEAAGGTLFLDEIGELDTSVQVKLLRALQEKEITRVGGNSIVKTDCRIIVATNRNLKEMVHAGKFRDDLYYRLLGLPIEMPALRERDHDIILLAKHFLTEFCKENKLPVKKLTESAVNKLLSHSYPGNVRELKSIVELAVVLSENEELSAADFSMDSVNVLAELSNSEMTMKEFNQRILSSFMQKHDNNIPDVAEKLDISVSTVYRMLKEMNGSN